MRLMMTAMRSVKTCLGTRMRSVKTDLTAMTVRTAVTARFGGIDVVKVGKYASIVAGIHLI